MRSLSYSDSSSKFASHKRGEHIFIRLYVDEFRRLIREKRLSRAEIGELVLLALFMDDEGTCFPSQQCAAETVGRKSGKWAGEIHRRLSDKDREGGPVILKLDDPTHRSNRYKLPECFRFGKKSR